MAARIGVVVGRSRSSHLRRARDFGASLPEETLASSTRKRLAFSAQDPKQKTLPETPNASQGSVVSSRQAEERAPLRPVQVRPGVVAVADPVRALLPGRGAPVIAAQNRSLAGLNGPKRMLDVSRLARRRLEQLRIGARLV